MNFIGIELNYDENNLLAMACVRFKDEIKLYKSSRALLNEHRLLYKFQINARNGEKSATHKTIYIRLFNP